MRAAGSSSEWRTSRPFAIWIDRSAQSSAREVEHLIDRARSAMRVRTPRARHARAERLPLAVAEDLGVGIARRGRGLAGPGHSAPGWAGANATGATLARRAAGAGSGGRRGRGRRRRRDRGWGSCRSRMCRRGRRRLLGGRDRFVTRPAVEERAAWALGARHEGLAIAPAERDPLSRAASHALAAPAAAAARSTEAHLPAPAVCRRFTDPILAGDGLVAVGQAQRGLGDRRLGAWAHMPVGSAGAPRLRVERHALTVTVRDALDAARCRFSTRPRARAPVRTAACEPALAVRGPAARRSVRSTRVLRDHEGGLGGGL